MPDEINSKVTLIITEKLQASEKDIRAEIERRDGRLERKLKRSGLKDASLVLLFSLLSAFGVYASSRQHFDTVVRQKIQEYSLDELKRRALVAAQAAESSAKIAREEFATIRGDDPLAIRAPHFLPPAQHKELWKAKGGESIIDVASSMHESARGVILKVILRPSTKK